MSNAIKYLQFKETDIFNKDTLQNQFKKLALIYHPDKRTNDNQELFKKLNNYHTYLLKFI